MIPPMPQSPMPAPCAYRGNAWSHRDVRECKSPATHGDMCAIHATVSCQCCNAQATHECPECLQFVCGAPLCDGCQHKPGGYSYDHVRKS